VERREGTGEGQGKIAREGPGRGDTPAPKESCSKARMLREEVGG